MISRTLKQKQIFRNIRAELLICLVLVMVTFAVYWQVKHFRFVNYDDTQYVTENPHVQAGLNYESIIWAFSSDHAANWHPLTWVSHMLDVELYGMNPGAHHQTNLIFHIANALLLFFIFRRMTANVWQSGFVAALFALHPLHVESVAWVAERKDVLSTFFWMLTMFSYVRYAARPGLIRYLAVVGFFMLGLMAKPMLVTLPFVLLLLDVWPLGRIQWNPPAADRAGNPQRSSGLWPVWEKIPLFVLAFASSVITFLVQKKGGAVGSLEIYPFTIRMANALVSYVSYLGKMVWPVNLAPFYPHAGILPVWQVVGAGALLGFITIVAIRSFRQRPWLMVGWLWFLGTLVPVIGLVQVGLQAMADRYTYIPLIGIFIIVAWGVPEQMPSWRYKEKLLGFAAIAVLMMLSITSWIQIQYWKNSSTLFQHALDVTENNYLAHNAFGNALKEQGKSDEAVRHYQSALEIKPDYAAPHYSIGHTLATQGNHPDAIKHFQKALQIKPDYAAVHDNLAYIFMQQGKFEEAIFHYSEALRIKPDDAAVHHRLGLALAKQGQLNHAITHFFKAVKINPLLVDAHYNLGQALLGEGRRNEAIKHYSVAILIKPDFASARYELANLLMETGNFSAANQHYHEVLRINPDHADAQKKLKKTRQALVEGDAGAKK